MEDDYVTEAEVRYCAKCKRKVRVRLHAWIRTAEESANQAEVEVESHCAECGHWFDSASKWIELV